MPIHTVLCPTDFSPLAERAASLAARICRRFGARLVLEHNLDPRPPGYLSVSWMWTEERKGADGARALEAEARLRAALDGLEADLPREATLTRGPMDEGLVALARALPADLLVIGSHGWSSAQHRSLTERLLETAPCPVLTLRDGGEPDAFLQRGDAPAPVLVPLDLSPHSRATAAYAAELAQGLPLALHFLYVEKHPFDAGYVGDCSRLEVLVPARLRGQVAIHVRQGKPADEILAVASEIGAEVILMGCHAKGALERMLTGATAREVLHRADCPVWFEPAARAQATAAAV
jgi:nucleotide-binding universal stress UspA family protein